MAFLSRLGGVFKTAIQSNKVSGAAAALPSTYLLSRAFSTKLFVGGLAWGTDERSLRDSFSEFGEIIEIRVITDRETGRSRGFGFVSYMTEPEAQKALEAMDGKAVDGRTIRVNYATQRAPGMGGFGGGGGGGYGGGGGSYGGGDGGNYGGGGGYGGSGGGSYGGGGGGVDGGSAFGGARSTESDPFDGSFGGAAGDAYKPPEEEDNRPPSTGGYGVTSGGYGVGGGASGGDGGAAVGGDDEDKDSAPPSRGYGASTF